MRINLNQEKFRKSWLFPTDKWERDQEKYKSDCLRRWRQARAICKMASLEDRRDELRRVGNQYGKEWEEKLRAEVKRQWT